MRFLSFRHPSAAVLVACTTCLCAPTRVQAQRPDSTQRLDRVLVLDSVSARRGYSAARTSSATRTSTLLRDVPQSATVITRRLLADHAMQSMAEVVRYIPGITMGQGEGHRDAPTIRGTSSTADFFIDGVRDDAQYYRDVYNVERVEALKGPNAMVFGRGGGGGVINRVTKDALFTPIHGLTLTGGSFDQRRAAIDVGQGVTRNVALRVNGLYENSANFRAESGSERIGVNPTATLIVGRSIVRVGYEYYDDQRVVDRGQPSFAGRPAVANVSTFFGDPTNSRSALTSHAVAATVDRQLWRGNALSDGLQLRNRSRFATYDKFYSNVFPGAVDATVTNVSLNAYNSATDRRNLFNQTDLTTTLTRGALRQTLLLGAEFGSQQTDNLRNTGYFGAANSTATSLAVPFARPTASTPVTFRQSATDATSATTLTTRAVYAQNQIAIGSHVQAIVGLRFDRLNVDFTNRRTNQQLARRDNLFSPRAGLVLKPVEAMSFYGSYAVSYLPGSGDQFGALTATSQTLEPEQFTNRELGFKWDARRKLSVTAAVYRLDRTNTTAPDPVTPGVIVQTGAQRTSGFELGVNGAPTEHWQVAGGYANQRAQILSRTSAAAAGATPALVPKQTLSLWNRYQIVRRIAAGVGVVHQSEVFTSFDNLVQLPAFTRVDAAAFLTLTRTIQAQVNIENLSNRRYFPTAHNNNNIMPGSPRMVRVSLNVGQ